MAFTVHRAGRADLLAAGLAELLREPLADPFARELVIVPAKGIERWLSQRLSHRLGPSDGHDDGVCAAVHFRSPGSLVAELTGTRDEDPWAPDALVWPLLQVIDTADGEPWARVLSAHLGHGLQGPEAELRRGRRFAVCRRLAGLFSSYAVQRPGLLAEWQRGSDTNGAGEILPDDLTWQPELWRRVVAAVCAPGPVERHRAVLDGLTAGTLVLDVPERVSLFGHTTMSRTEAELLAALGSHRDVHLWLPHPSAALWDRGGTPADSVNPLLLSLGRDVRELQQTLVSVGAVDGPVRSSSDPAPATLLGRIQSDIAADRPPTSGPPDSTVQVHACHGPSRQVEVLREVLLGLLADDPTLQPRDILVMCPDIEAYAPLVTAAFGLGDAVAGAHPGQQLRVMLADRSPTQTNPLLGVLAKVLDLAGGRAEATRVLDLLGTDAVSRRFGFSDSDLETITGWVSSAGIRWAYDAAHREAWDLQAYPQNTWRFGLDRILAGVALSDDSDLWLGPTLPLDDVASTSIGLAGRLAEALDRLQRITDGLTGSHPVEVWLERLREGVDQLTDVARGEEWQLAQVHRELGRLGGSAEGAEAPLELRLSDVRSLLHAQLAGRPTRASFRTGTLTVCTLTPMRSVPHRVVCLLGVDDGVFPRGRGQDGDDVLGRRRLPGERDARSQERQLFLDAIMAAGEHLVITYTGFHEATGQPRPPAVPLKEFLDVLDRTAPRSKGHVVKHRSQSFHRDYLVPGGVVGRRDSFSFDPDAAGAARAAVAERTAPDPLAALDLGPAPVGDLALADLVATVVNPVKAFVSRRLLLEVPFEEADQADSIPVRLSGLHQWQIGERMLLELLRGGTADHALQAEWRRGSLPPGRLGWRQAQQICQTAGPIAQLTRQCMGEADASAVDVDLDLGVGRCLVGTVTGVYADRLVRWSYSRVQARHRVEAWVGLTVLAAAGHQDLVAGAVGRAQEGDAPARATYRQPDDPAAVLRGLVDFHDAAMTAPLPYSAETARLYVNTLQSSRPPWMVQREVEKCWRKESRASELQRVWGRVPAYDDVCRDPRFDQWARTLWTPMLAAEVE